MPQTFEEAVARPFIDGAVQDENIQSQEPTETQTNSENQEQIPQGQELKELWKESNEFKQGLWKTTDDVYNSVKYYQQKFTPLEQSFKKLGFNKPEEIEQAFKSYQDNLPKYLQAQETLNMFDALLADPTHGARLQAAIKEIQRAKEVEKFGISYDELPQPIREKVERGEIAYQKLQELEQRQEYEKNVNLISKQIQAIDELAKNYGYDVNMQEFVNYCKENNVPPYMMKATFMDMNFAQIVERAQQNASMQTSLTKQGNKRAAVLTSSKTTPQSVPKTPSSIGEFEEALLNAL